MHINMIIPTSFPGTRGSPARVYETSRTLAARGISVNIFCYNDGHGKPLPESIKVYRIPKLPFYKKGIGPSFSRIILDVFLFYSLFFSVLKDRPDLLHCHLHEGALIGLLIGKLFRIPVIFDIHSSLKSELIAWNFFKNKRRLFIKTIADYLDKNLPKWVDYNIVLSEKQLDYYRKLNNNIKVIKVSNPTDITHFKPIDSKLKRDLHLEDKILIGYQGNMTSLQNLGLLIEAAEVIVTMEPNVNFLIGYTSDPKEFFEIVNRKKLDKYFISIPAPYEKASEIINGCDIMIISKSETSSVPMKLSNFMACGKPVVLRKEFIKSITAEDNAIGLFGYQDKTELVNLLLKLINNKELREKNKNNMLHFVKNEFSYASIFQKLITVYNHVTSNRRISFFRNSFHKIQQNFF